MDSRYDDRETAELIYASKVKGTDVYDAADQHIGSIDDIALTKIGGEVAYAVLSFGGFLGIGEKYHPLPWNALDYDTRLGGYRVATAGENLREAPSFTRAELAQSAWRQQTDQYYRSDPAQEWARRPRGRATAFGAADGPGNTMETGPGGTVRPRAGLADESLEDDGTAATIRGDRAPL